jgi:histidine ammonia-lyase
VIELDGSTLSLSDVEAVANGANIEVALSTAGRAGITRARRYLESRAATGEKIYGVNTGFGRLAETLISPDQTEALQNNLVRSHAAGVGDPLPVAEVRAMMLLRANALARGNSGCRVDVVECLLNFLNHGLHPWVPSAGSVGASGDLAPLAHIALALIGEGDLLEAGTRTPVTTQIEGAGVAPLRLREKEGLALINGTQATTGVGTLAFMRAVRALDAVDVAGAMSLEGLLGTPDAFREEIQIARPHSGQAATAARLRLLLADSEIRESHRTDDPRVQDAYSLRCMPQVHGAARQALGYVRGVLEVEVNSTTDNPLIFPESELIVSGGNFHAQIVAQALDLMVLALTDVAAISERRIERLLNPDLSGLPAFLACTPGLESGYMIAQVTAADLIAEMRTLSHPASADTISTSAAREDHVSMGFWAARKARRAVECFEAVVAIELLCGAEGLEHRQPLQPGRGVRAAYARLREEVPALAGDRPPGVDIERIITLVRNGNLDMTQELSDV